MTLYEKHKLILTSLIEAQGMSMEQAHTLLKEYVREIVKAGEQKIN